MTEVIDTTTISAINNNNNNNNNNNYDNNRLDNVESVEEQCRYDAIEDELRLLSDWHRMTERSGCLEEDNKNKSCSDNRITKKGAGRTRTLKPKHLGDFSDEDYRKAFHKEQPRNSNIVHDENDNENEHENEHEHENESFRRFRIFNKFAKSVCNMNAIARKEIFEAWAMALYVHETFLSTEAISFSGRRQQQRTTPIKRFADLVCSHGLLSWALLLLASSEEEEDRKQQQQQQQQFETTHQQTTQEQNKQQRPMTAVCIDIAMPKSSETAAGIFFKEFPQFCDDHSSSSSSRISTPMPTPIPSPQTSTGSHPRWDYVEGPVESMVPHESTLLVGIHACGRLSDTIIDQAISSNAPLALVPCCHSKKILTPDQAKGFAALVASSKCVPATTTTTAAPIVRRSISLADFTDSFRKQRLVDAGYDVREVWIPVEFTPKNRIILAVPPRSATPSAIAEASARLQRRKRKGWGIPYFPIPLEDGPNARAAIRSIAGRALADQRKNDAHPPPAICVSVWMPKPTTNEEEKETTTTTPGEEKQETIVVGDGVNSAGSAIFSVEALQRVLEQQQQQQQQQQVQNNTETKTKTNTTGPTVRVEDATHKLFRHPTDGRLSKTFRVHYLDCRNNKAKARALHKTLMDVTIPLHFPAVAIRA